MITGLARRPVRTTVTAVAAAALAASGLAGCASGGGSGSGPGTAAPAPATGAAGGDPHTANVVITAADGCTPDRLRFDAGPITFHVVNRDATAVSEVELLGGERIIGEKENLPPGLSGSFSVSVDAGSYTLYCPGAARENITLTVTGKSTSNSDASVTALLDTGVTQYAKYVDDQVGYLVQSVTALDKALHGTDLAAAQAAYMKARPYYEKIEPVAESFTVGSDSLDADIDARANDVPASEWKGFHRIEKGLFQDKSLAGLGGYGDGLLANVTKLQTLTEALTYKPFELANGAQELFDEVASTKITGEEERYSLIDLLDFEANDEGAGQAFACLQPALARIDPALTASISSRFAALDKLVDTYRTGANPSGFVLYDTLTASDKQALAAAVTAVQEPLAQAAAKVAKA